MRVLVCASEQMFKIDLSAAALVSLVRVKGIANFKYTLPTKIDGTFMCPGNMVKLSSRPWLVYRVLMTPWGV